MRKHNTSVGLATYYTYFITIKEIESATFQRVIVGDVFEDADDCVKDANRMRELLEEEFVISQTQIVPQRFIKKGKKGK